MTALLAGGPLPAALSASSAAYLLSVLLISWAALQLRGRAAYSCPTCGSKRADGHSPECPWSSRR